MKVYFSVCGIGLGHVGRCVFLAKKLLERGDDVIFSTYSDACNYLTYEKMPFIQAPPINFAVKDDGEVDFRQTTAYPGAFSILIFLNQVTTEIKHIRAFKPDIIISDSRASPILAAKLLGLPVLTILNLYRVTIPRERRFLRLARIADSGIFTVLGHLWNMSEEILIPDFPEPYTLSENNLGIPPWRKNHIRLVGPVIPLKPSELPDQKEIRRKLNLLEGRVIFVPISGPSQEKEYFTRQMLEILTKIPMNYRVIVSLANPNFSSEPSEKGNITIYNWLPNRFEFLKACDMVISRAGLGTITQSICYGKPMLLIPTPSQTEQQNNAYRAETLGVAKVLYQKKICPQNILDNIKEIFSDGYVERADNMRREVERYNATDNIIQTMDYYGKKNASGN